MRFCGHLCRILETTDSLKFTESTQTQVRKRPHQLEEFFVHEISKTPHWRDTKIGTNEILQTFELIFRSYRFTRTQGTYTNRSEKTALTTREILITWSFGSTTLRELKKWYKMSFCRHWVENSQPRVPYNSPNPHKPKWGNDLDSKRKPRQIECQLKSKLRPYLDWSAKTRTPNKSKTTHFQCFGMQEIATLVIPLGAFSTIPRGQGASNSLSPHRRCLLPPLSLESTNP